MRLRSKPANSSASSSSVASYFVGLAARNGEQQGFTDG
jgi:hypothetical protein